MYEIKMTHTDKKSGSDIVEGKVGMENKYEIFQKCEDLCVCVCGAISLSH